MSMIYINERLSAILQFYIRPSVLYMINVASLLLINFEISANDAIKIVAIYMCYNGNWF